MRAGRGLARSVGRPLHNVNVRIAPDGEILVRGPNVFGGYLDAEDDAELWTEDRFLRTGDLGSLDADGYLFITGRKKNLFVLSTGKKLSPEPIENALTTMGGPVEAAVLVGDGESFLCVGFFVPKNALADLRAQHGSDDDVCRFLLSLGQQRLAGFAEYEKPIRGFLVEGGIRDHGELLTPTMKIKRASFNRKFAGAIERIYGQKGQRDSWATLLLPVATAKANDPSALPAALIEAFAKRLGRPVASEVVVAQLGLDSIDLVELQRALGDVTRASIPLGELAVLSLRDLAERVARGDSGAERGLFADARACSDLEKDVALLETREISSEAANSGAAFVTGATGFLGAFLVHELLARTDEPLEGSESRSCPVYPP